MRTQPRRTTRVTRSRTSCVRSRCPWSVALVGLVDRVCSRYVFPPVMFRVGTAVGPPESSGSGCSADAGVSSAAAPLTYGCIGYQRLCQNRPSFSAAVAPCAQEVPTGPEPLPNRVSSSACWLAKMLCARETGVGRGVVAIVEWRVERVPQGVVRARGPGRPAEPAVTGAVLAARVGGAERRVVDPDLARRGARGHLDGVVVVVVRVVLGILPDRCAGPTWAGRRRR